MDIGLKGKMNRIDTAYKIYKKIPVIFISGNTHLIIEDIKKTIEPLGISDKPIACNELIKILNILCLRKI